jgi:hypothetical protein
VVGAFVNPNDMTRNSEKALVIPEQCLHHIVWAHQHLLVARLQVKLGEELHALEFIEQFLHDGYLKFILHRLLVQRPVVDAEPP